MNIIRKKEKIKIDKILPCPCGSQVLEIYSMGNLCTIRCGRCLREVQFLDLELTISIWNNGREE